MSNLVFPAYLYGILTSPPPTTTIPATPRALLQAIQGFYGISMFFSLLLITAVVFHWPFGVALMISLCLLLAIIYFVIGGALAFALVVESDICPNMEQVAVYVAPQYAPVLQYYLSPSAVAGGLTSALATSKIVNLTDVQAQISSQLTSASASIQALSAGLPSGYQAAFASVLALLNTTLVQLNASIGAEQASSSTSSSSSSSVASSGGGVLGAAGYTSVHGLYVNVKAEVCCTISDSFVTMWAVLTALGFLLMLSSLFSMFVLALLDELPGSGACCGCRFLTPGRLAAIADEEGDDGRWAGNGGPAANGGLPYDAPKFIRA